MVHWSSQLRDDTAVGDEAQPGVMQGPCWHEGVKEGFQS